MKKTPNGLPPSKEQRDAIRSLLNKATPFMLGNYVYVSKHRNLDLFRLLKKFGFFKFHVTNTNQSLIAVHQVVAYLGRGWKLYYYGNQRCCKGQLEIHHLDTCTTNNEYRNLWYVTPTENQVLDTITQVCFDTQAKNYKGMARFDLDVINVYRDTSKSFCQLIVDTLNATSRNLNKVLGTDHWDLLKVLFDHCPFKQAQYIKKHTLILV